MNRKLIPFFWLLLLGFVSHAEVLHEPVMQGVKNEFKVPDLLARDSIFTLDGQSAELVKHMDGNYLTFIPGSNRNVVIKSENGQVTESLPNRPIPLWLSIIPPLMAILLAFVFREVITSLVLGIFSGTAIIGFYTSGLSGIFTGWLQIVEKYITRSMVPDAVNGEVGRGHISVIVFSIIIGGLVSIISKNGGMMAVVRKMSRWAKDARSGQLVTWFLGVIIFFDDYANTLIVGNTMRPVTDRLKISREKLAYLVDATAAPVAAIAFITTWIGAELDYIQSGLSQIPEIQMGAYGVFLSSLKYAFYPILTLIFMLLIIWKRKDFGPMYHAEIKARKSEAVETKSAQPGDVDHVKKEKENIWNAVLPIFIMVFGTIAGLIVTGYDADIWHAEETGFLSKLSSTIGASDSYKALLWSSFGGLTAAILLTVAQKIAKLNDVMEWAMEGFKNMLGAVAILILAWSLALVSEELRTSDFLSGWLTGKVDPVWFPALTFLLASLVAFSTGSSWSTMAILYPILLVSAWKISIAAGMDHDAALQIFFNVTACVLSGSVLGDHCSPISDTTILSSLSTQCNHIDHVRTQMPYAMVVGLVSVVFGTLLTSFGIPAWIGMLTSIGVLYLVVSYFGKMVEEPN
jgi:hypothetical protein